jgi:hypothetical protein
MGAHANHHVIHIEVVPRRHVIGLMVLIALGHAAYLINSFLEIKAGLQVPSQGSVAQCDSEDGDDAELIGLGTRIGEFLGGAHDA